MGHQDLDSKPLPDNAVCPVDTALRKELVAAGLIVCDARWTPYSGGRTNAIWRIEGDGRAVVCKLYKPAADSPLFPNDAAAEVRALSALAGTGLAPDLIATRTTTAGACLLYRHVEGTPFDGDVAEVARALARLHSQPSPAGLREIPPGAVAIKRQGMKMLDGCTSSGAHDLRATCPSVPEASRSPTVFLHGDLVPANIIAGPDGLTFIDWQCPATGDPVEDLATFLSPAMQSLYGGQSLDEGEQRRFLEAYGNPDVIPTYRALKPLFHWRMAAHCLWKAERGSSDYADAMQLELAALKLR